MTTDEAGLLMGLGGAAMTVQLADPEAVGAAAATPRTRASADEIRRSEL